MRRQLRRTLVCLTLLAVLAGAAPIPASAAGFQDVPSGHWAAESIQRSVDLGFFQGQSPTRFGLGGELSRGAFAVILCRFYGWDTEAPEKSSFQDVEADAAGPVEALLSHGVITSQRPDFRPEEPLSREDLAVMLVRSLGYGALAGLVQDLPTHFQDLHTNIGYIAMAYNLGLTNGTSAATFSPDRAVTREEAAVTLVRLYDKLHAAPPEIAAVLSAPEEGGDLPDLTGLDVAAIPAGRLMGVGDRPTITALIPADTASALRSAAREAGAKTLLHITCGPSALDAPLDETAALLAAAAAENGCDGLMLDVPELKRDRRKDLTELVQLLRKELGEGLLYLTVEAPAWQGREYGGYDFAVLDAYVDKLILRVISYEETQTGGFPVAPVNPLEEVYYALLSMKGRVELSQLSLLMDLEPAVWGTDARPRELKPEELAAVLASGQRQYSQRYGCAYLDGLNGDEPVGVWYLDQEAILARRQLVQAFGIDHLTLSGLEGELSALVG